MEITDNVPAIVGEAVAGRSALVRHSLSTLASSLKRHTFDLAELLYEAKDYCREWGFKSLGDYAVKELDIKERKAQYLTRIVEVYRIVMLLREEYEPVGVSKLREITSLDPKGAFWNEDTKVSEPLDRHIVRLTRAALRMSYAEVEAEVSRLKNQVEENKMVSRAYKVTQSAWDNVVSKAFELARKRLGSAGRDSEGTAKDYPDGVCVEMICQEFLSDPNNYTEEERVEQTEIETENKE
jgi:hypothetical protein